MQPSYQYENMRNSIVFYTSIHFQENHRQCFFSLGMDIVGWDGRIGILANPFGTFVLLCSVLS